MSLPSGVNVTASIVGSILRSSGIGAPRPRLTSTVGNRTFYYISQTVRRRFQFQDFTVIDQRVLVIYFNKAFKVERIANYGLQDGVIFDFISRTTPTGGEEQSFLRNLFRGVTKFNPLGA